MTMSWPSIFLKLVPASKGLRLLDLQLIFLQSFIKTWWCPKMYAASNKSVVDIEKSDGKCLNVIEHLLGKTAGFTHRTAYPLA